jgi:hypothetical protein
MIGFTGRISTPSSIAEKSGHAPKDLILPRGNIDFITPATRSLRQGLRAEPQAGGPKNRSDQRRESRVLQAILLLRNLSQEAGRVQVPTAGFRSDEP